MLLLCLAGPATTGLRAAQDEDPRAPPVDDDQQDIGSIVPALLKWIGDNSDYDVTAFLNDPLPVSFCDVGQTVVYEGRPIVVHEPVKGMYDIEIHRITLVKPWSRKDLINISTLLHELVHFVQYESRDWSCWHATEWEAYKLQEQWLLERGIDPGFNWVEIYLLSRCAPRDIHR